MARSRLLSPTVLLKRSGFYKGVLGGSKGWLAVFLLIWGRGKAKSAFGKTEQTIAVETLKPGEFVTLRTIKPPTRKDKRNDKRSLKEAAVRAEVAKAEAKKAAKDARRQAKATTVKKAPAAKSPAKK